MTKYDKAIFAFIIPVLLFVAEAALTAEANAVGAAFETLADPNIWIIAFLTSFVVWAKGNANTIYTDDPDQVRKFLEREAGGVSVRAVLGLALTLMLLAGCFGSGDPKTVQRAAALAQCSTTATVQGLAFGSPERAAFVATCFSNVIAGIVVEDLIITDDDARAGGGKL